MEMNDYINNEDGISKRSNSSDIAQPSNSSRTEPFSLNKNSSHSKPDISVGYIVPDPLDKTMYMYNSKDGNSKRSNSSDKILTDDISTKRTESSSLNKNSSHIPDNSVEYIPDPIAKTVQKGDLYWGQTGSFPFWPCMVIPDPENQEISSERNHFGKPYEAFHVRFFADNGKRSWVKKSKLIPYDGSSNFYNKIKAMKNKSFDKLYKRGMKYKNWPIAIEEADMIRSVQPESRMMKFENILENSKVKRPAKIQKKKGYKKGRLL